MRNVKIGLLLPYARYIHMNESPYPDYPDSLVLDLNGTMGGCTRQHDWNKYQISHQNFDDCMEDGSFLETTRFILANNGTSNSELLMPVKGALVISKVGSASTPYYQMTQKDIKYLNKYLLGRAIVTAEQLTAAYADAQDAWTFGKGKREYLEELEFLEPYLEQYEEFRRNEAA